MMASRKTEGGEHTDDAGGSDGSVTIGPFSSALSSLFVIHRTLGSSDEAASEAEQYDKVLAYFPGKHAVARQLQLVSFVEGLIDFTARFGEKDNEIVQIVNLKKRCICFYPCEPPDIWLVAVLREPTGLAGDGSDRFNVNGPAVRTLLDLIYRGFVLFHGSISEALASPTKEGPEAIERVKAVRKRIRKNEAKRSLLEGGYGDDDEDEPDGDKAEAVEGNGSLEAKLSALAAAKADLESDLSEALRQSPATRLKRQLQAFLQVYLCGIDFENVHLFENLPAFHMATVDPPLYRKVHGLRHALADVAGQASALAGLCVVLEGQLVGYSGLSQDEMLLTYTYFKLRDFAHMTQQSLPGLPGASSVPEPGPATPSSAARSVEEAAPALDPPQTVAGAFETHRRKTSGIMGKLSGLAQRLKASGVASATSDSDTRPEEEIAVDPRAPAARGFLAEDGLRYTSTQLQQDGGTIPAGGGGGPPRLWCPRLHKVGKAADDEARPPRCLLGYATERLLVLVVLRDDGGGGPGLDSRQLAAMASEVESALGSETASHVPPTERLGSPAPSVTASSSNTSASSSSSSSANTTSPMELSRFIYHDRVTRSLFTSHPAKSVPGLQAWPPPSLFLCKHRSSVLSPLVLSVLDDFNLQLRDLTWGDRDGQEGPYRELSMRTREDGWIVARQSAGREVYAMVDPRLSSILDAQEALDALLHQCFARVHVP